MVLSCLLLIRLRILVWLLDKGAKAVLRTEAPFESGPFASDNFTSIVKVFGECGPGPLSAPTTTTWHPYREWPLQGSVVSKSSEWPKVTLYPCNAAGGFIPCPFGPFIHAFCHMHIYSKNNANKGSVLLLLCSFFWIHVGLFSRRKKNLGNHQSLWITAKSDMWWSLLHPLKSNILFPQSLIRRNESLY